MSRTTHDYKMLRQEYITSDISIRALCEKHGIKSWSTVNQKKNDENWDADREAFKAQLASREIQTLVDERIRTVAEIHSELLYAIRVAVRRFTNDRLRDDNPDPVNARDLMGLIDKFLLLTGQATARTESRSLVESHDFGGILRDAPPELLRELAELARANGAGAKPVGRGPLVVLEGTRTA